MNMITTADDPYDPYDECECGHLREDHDKEGCMETATSGYTCACDGFEKASW